MTTLQERLAEIFPAPLPRGTQASIARLCQVSRPTVSAWFHLPEKVSSLERVHAELICEQYAPGISPAWLAEGRPPKHHKAARNVERDLAPPPAPSSPSGKPFSAPTDDELAFLDDLRVLLDSDREKYIHEIAVKAMQMRAHMEKVMGSIKGKEKP